MSPLPVPYGTPLHVSSEEAVEFDELDKFLRLNDTWHEDEERPTLPQQPVGVPGAMTPLEMTPERLKPIIQQRAPSPLGPDAPKPVPVNKRKTVLLDAGEVFSGFGLQGEKVRMATSTLLSSS